jgi:branched-chain amino acid aminotransferase
VEARVMAERMAYVNGEILPESQASVSIFDRGFLAGLGVFERTRTYHGELFRLDEHLRRLSRSLRVSRIEPGLSMEALKARTLELVEQNRGLLGPNDDYTVAHFITRGRPAAGPTVVMFCDPIDFTAFAHQYLRGGHVVTPSTRQVPTQVLDPKMKTTSRLYLYLAQEEAQLVDPDAYALILDLDGNVCETYPGANFAIIRDGVLITPPSRSILPGITLLSTLEVARAIGLPIREVDFQPYDVMTADEAFVMTSSRCVVPITRVNGCPIGDGTPGPLVARLQNGWAEHYGMDFVSQALAHLDPEAARELASQPATA